MNEQEELKEFANIKEDERRQIYLESGIGGNGFLNCFFGPKDRKTADGYSRDLVKIRGTNLFYWIKTGVPARTDGITNGSNNTNLGPFDTRSRTGNAGIYGENINIGDRIDAVTREITPAWGYQGPIPFRGAVLRTHKDDQPNEKGHIEILKVDLDLSRAMCEDINLIPQSGDVVEFGIQLQGYFDVELVTPDKHRFGETGFFTSYSLNLKRNSSFYPQRKNLPN